MTTSPPKPASARPWQPVMTGDEAVAVAERDALGTSARVAVWPPCSLGAACAAVDDVLAALDRQASRFREDSEISWLHRAGGGLFLISDGLAEAIGVALAAARWTGGLTDPTVGQALLTLGYDRDFAAIGQEGGELPATPAPVPGWQHIQLDGRLLRLPAGIWLDLGATAKGVGADRAVQAVLSATGHTGGVLVGLGGDIAVGGTPPRDGWPVTAADGPDQAGARLAPRAGPAADDQEPAASQLVRLAYGGVATSSMTTRRWRRGNRVLHHIVDPRTGFPACGPWRTVSAVAATCADANAATTAAIVAGLQAEDWLATTGLPARLVAHDGEVRYLGGWPAAEGLPVPVPPDSHVYAGVHRLGGTR
jgi:FAD:protein FMN transferase